MVGLDHPQSISPSSAIADELRKNQRPPGHPFPDTLPGTNMEVENGPLEDHVPLQTGGFGLPF